METLCIGCRNDWPTETVNGRRVHYPPREYRNDYDDSFYCQDEKAPQEGPGA
jgi:hypothetical protein